MKLTMHLIILFLFFTGCSQDIPTPNQRLQTLEQIAQKNELEKKVYQLNHFELLTLHQKNLQECKKIKIYIEGDGLAWKSRNVISNNPTPINPIGLSLMTQEKNCSIYFARVGQYITQSYDKKYWTSHRFSKTILEDYIQLLDVIKNEYENEIFDVIGYSGGGAFALLIAANRDDIKNVITVAGNLNHSYWSEYLNISPLNGSLNPVNFAYELSHVNQYHLIGNNDKIIPFDVFKSYIQYFQDRSNIQYFLFDAAHNCCWDEIYRNFLLVKSENLK